MDFQEDKEIAFKRNPEGATLDEDEDDSGATVKLAAEDQEQIPRFHVVSQEDSTSMLQFLVKEVQELKSRNEELAEQVRKQSAPPSQHVPHPSHSHDPPPMVHMVGRSERRTGENISPSPPDDGVDDAFDDDVDDELSLASSKMVGFVPRDQGRWKFTKASELARVNFTEQLKDHDIAKHEENWSKFDRTFRTVVESLELYNYIFEPVQPHPQSHAELMRTYSNNDGVRYAEQVIPGMYHDVLGRIHHRDPEFRGVEIIHEEEKRRFDAAMMLLFSILTSCTSSPRLDGVLDTDRARESKNLPRMYQILREHFVSMSGTNIVQKMLQLCSIARYDPSDKGSVRAIEVIRESQRALSDRNVECPQLFFVAIFLATLEADSAIRQRLDVLIIDKGATIRLDEVIQIFQVWYRDQEIQRSTQSLFGTKSTGKPPRDPKTLLLTVEQQKQFRACAKVGACFECLQVKGNMDQRYAECKAHNKRGKKPKIGDSSKINLARLPGVQPAPLPPLHNDVSDSSNVVDDFSLSPVVPENQESRSTLSSTVPGIARAANLSPPSVLKDLLVEATNAVNGATEEFDLSPLQHHDRPEDVSFVKTNAVLLIDSGAARTTVPSSIGLSNVQRLARPMNLEFADGNKGSPIEHEGTLYLNGRELSALVSSDLHDGRANLYWSAGPRSECYNCSM